MLVENILLELLFYQSHPSLSLNAQDTNPRALHPRLVERLLKTLAPPDPLLIIPLGNEELDLESAARTLGAVVKYREDADRVKHALDRMLAGS